MQSIPEKALSFGALTPYQQPVAYGKSRISGCQRMSYIMCDKAGSMPGQSSLFTANARSNPGQKARLKTNKVIRAFQRESFLKTHSPIGSKTRENCSSHGYTFEKFEPHEDEVYELALKASYRQVYGNFQIMDSERSIDLERRLRNGDITIREFIRGLSKSIFYKAHYFEVVSQQRCIELSFKHILGRPPESQEEIVFHVKLLNSHGFDSHIDELIDSDEYQEIFGSDIVPYPRCWDSQLGLKTISFNRMATLSKRFATSDNALHGRPTLWDQPGGKSMLVLSLANLKTSFQGDQPYKGLSEVNFNQASH